MFVDRLIVRSHHPRYTLPAMTLGEGEEAQFFFDSPEGVNAISLKDSFNELVFSVGYEAGTHAPYADGDQKNSVVLDPINLSTQLLVLVEKRKEIGKFDNAQIACWCTNFQQTAKVLMVLTVYQLVFNKKWKKVNQNWISKQFLEDIKFFMKGCCWFSWESRKGCIWIRI